MKDHGKGAVAVGRVDKDSPAAGQLAADDVIEGLVAGGKLQPVSSASGASTACCGRCGPGPSSGSISTSPIRSRSSSATWGSGSGRSTLGAAEDRDAGTLLTPLAEALLARTTLPAVIIWDGGRSRLQTTTGFDRVLFPVVATVPNRAAQEVAFSLAAASDADVVVAGPLRRPAPAHHP